MKRLTSEIVHASQLKIILPRVNNFRGWIILPRVNNFIIKHKEGIEYLFYFMLSTQNKIEEDKSQLNTAKCGDNTSFFRKNWTATYLATTPGKSFYISFEKF